MWLRLAVDEVVTLLFFDKNTQETVQSNDRKRHLEGISSGKTTII